MKRVLPNEKVKMFLLKFPHIQASHFKDFEQWTTIDHSDYQVQKLPKAQRTQGNNNIAFVLFRHEVIKSLQDQWLSDWHENIDGKAQIGR